MSRCPDATRIAAYLDDRLFEEERRALEEHFAMCESCWREFADSIACLAELRAGDGEGEPLAPRRLAWLGNPLGAMPRRSLAIAATLAVIVGATGWLVHHRLAMPAAGDASELQTSILERRPVVPRFTGMEWKPRPKDRVRGVTATASVEPGAWRYQKMVDEARLAAGASPSGAQLQRLGAAYLLAGDADGGLLALERAAAAVPEAAHTLSDLGAAYLARGIEHNDGNDVAQALETIGRALDADPDLLEARFNHAVALQEMPLPGEAERAWKAYLELDSRSQWAREAEMQLDRLAKQAVEAPDAAQIRVEIVAAATTNDPSLVDLLRSHRQEARDAFMLDLLPAWGNRAVEGDEAEATAHLDSARRLASEWNRQTDDHSLLRQVEQIEQAGGERNRFARGHEALAKGLEALESLQVEQATAAFASAKREFPSSSAARGWVDVSALACEFYRRGPDAALLGEIRSLEVNARDDAPLRAHLAWLHGLMRFRRGEPQALDLFDQSLREFERLEEIDHVAWLHSLYGDALTLFGDLPRAWLHRRQVLTAFPQLAHRGRRFEILLGPAIGAAYLERRPYVASSLLAELASQRGGWPPRQSSELQLWLSRVSMTLGDDRQARTHWQAASAWLSHVEDLDVRRRLAAELQAASGSIAESPAAALAALSTTIERSRRGAPDFRFPGLLLERARAYRVIGDQKRALADLREGVDWLSRQPSAGPVQRLWSQRLAGADALFDQLVAAELAAGLPEQAFDAEEQGRWQALSLAAGTEQRSDVPLTAQDTPPTFVALQKGLEPGTALLYFCLLDKEALVWRVESAGVRTIRLAASPAAIAARATQLQTDLAAGEWTSRTEAAARDLYRDLISAARLDADIRQLVVVPDGPLDQLPFAALLDPSSGQFLIEQRAVTMAPSAAAFLAARARQRQLTTSTSSVLALGDPLPDNELYPTLRPLAAAREEARLVARSYDRGVVLVGEQATRDVLLTQAGNYSVLHFAGHAVTNLVDPSRSSLALAHPSGGDQPGAVFAYELPPARFDHTRLVVLAGCGTGSGPASAGAGTISLARAFLAARVPTVVASFWPVADGKPTELMTAFHAGVARGEEPAAALRAAQLSLLRSADPGLRSPATWAAFGVLGG